MTGAGADCVAGRIDGAAVTRENARQPSATKISEMSLKVIFMKYESCRTSELTRRREFTHHSLLITHNCIHASAARVQRFVGRFNIQNVLRQITETLQSLRTHAPGMVVRRCLSLSWDKVSLY